MKKVFSCIVAAATLFSISGGAPVEAAAIGQWGVDLSDQDHSVRPGDDFFRFQNGDWVARAAPDVHNPFMSYWRDVRNVAPARLRTILDELVSDPAAAQTPPLKQAVTLYREYLNEAAIERRGHAPLEPELKAIRTVKTRSEVARLMGHMEGPETLRGANMRDGYGRGMFRMNVAQDARMPEHNALYLAQGGLMLPDPSYYSAPEVADVREKYRAYVEQVLTLIGWPEPHARASDVLAFETRVAAVSTPLEQLVDPALTYNPVSLTELRKLAPGFDWTAYFAGAGIAHPNRLVIDDPKAFGRIADEFAKANLDMLRARQAFAATDYNAALLSHDLFAAKVGFRTNVLNTPSLAARDRMDGAERLVEAVTPDVLGSIYVQRFVPPEVDAGAKRMAEALRGALDARFATATWLSGESKAEARRKVARMQIRVGYPSHFDDYSGLNVGGRGLYEDVHGAAVYEWRELVGRLARPFDNSRWLLPPMYPQYLYDPQSNAAEVSVALFQPPFFDSKADDAVNYGAVGTVVASKMMDAFNLSGIRYDSGGRLRDWLRPEEVTHLARLGGMLANRYSAFEPVPGVHPRGKVLLDEALSDIGAIELALDAYRTTLGGHAAPVVDGLTGDQRFFLGRAQSWRARFSDDAMRNQLTQGSNAIPWMRVNGPLPNVDEWYAAFGVTPGDKLYLPPDQRLHLW
jgi:putative endopeptidase